MIEQAGNELDCARSYPTRIHERITEAAKMRAVGYRLGVKQHPRWLGTIAYGPGRKLSEFLVTVENVPGAIGKVSTAFGLEDSRPETAESRTKGENEWFTIIQNARGRQSMLEILNDKGAVVSFACS